MLLFCFSFTIGISWSPQYDLNIVSDDCQHTFQAFAEINNTTKQEYRVDKTELFGGDLQLERDIKIKRRLSRSRSRSMSPDSNTDSDDELFCDPTPTIRAAGDLAGNLNFLQHSSFFTEIMTRSKKIGLYLYTIDQSFTLLPKSTVGLPFIEANIRVSKCFGLTLPFSSHTEIKKLQRKYRIEAVDKFLPGGPLTIRELGKLVGVATLPDMAVGDKHTLNSGQDPDVSKSFPVAMFE